MPLQAIVPKTHLKNPKTDIVRELRKWQGSVIRDMADYPAQRGGVTYKRRGAAGGYAGHWKFTLEPAGGVVFNNAEHAIYLGGPTSGPKGKRAVWWARSYGWRSLSTVSNKHNKVLQKALGVALRSAVKFTAF